MNLAPVEQDLRDFDGVFSCLPEPPDIAVQWRALVVRHQVHGRQVHVARLVALMDAHGVTELLTLNSADIARYAHITCLAPDEV